VGADQLASERTPLAAKRTFSAWIRTGLAAIGGGLAVARVLVFKSPAHELLAHAIGGLLVVWGASVFIHAIVSTITPARNCHKWARSETHWAR
jgi:putative membrane protein